MLFPQNCAATNFSHHLYIDYYVSKLTVLTLKLSAKSSLLLCFIDILKYYRDFKSNSPYKDLEKPSIPG